MLHIVCVVPGSHKGRIRPTLRVESHEDNYQVDICEGIVPAMVANRYTSLEGPGQAAFFVPGQRGYESLTRYLPSENDLATRIADYLVAEFDRVTRKIGTNDVAKIWGKTIQILQESY